MPVLVERHAISEELARGWGRLNWARPVISLIVDGAGEVVDYQLEQLLPPVKGQRRYFRVQQRLTQRTAGPDDVSSEDVGEPRRLGEAMALAGRRPMPSAGCWRRCRSETAP